MRSPQTVLFDFDYTLADSSVAVIECVNTALAAMSLPSAPEESIRRTIGLSLPATLVRLAGETHRHRAQEFRGHFRRRSDQVMVGWTHVYPDVPAVLERLQRCGLKIGIVSTKYRYRIEAVLRRERLSERFDAVIGGEDVAEFKPHPEGLLKALERTGSAPPETVYVGDSTTDAEAAQRAGVPFMAVLSGVTTREELAPYQPLKILDSFVDVTSVLGC